MIRREITPLSIWSCRRRRSRDVVGEKDIVASKDGLVMQPMLPTGFRRARHFGFLHPNCKRLIALLPLLLKFDPGRTSALLRPRAPIVSTAAGQ